MPAREPKIGEVRDVAKAIRMAAPAEESLLGNTVFLIGAGCSKSAGIPLAREIAERLILELAERMGGDGNLDSLAAYRWLAAHGHIKDCCVGEAPSPIAVADARPVEWARVYDTLFSDHFTTPDEVRRIFTKLVQTAGERMNWSHICLGELVRKRLISSIITTNFDQLALAGVVRSGIIPVVCDGLESLSRIQGQPTHPQLIELHGSRHTYRLRNSPEELADLRENKAAIAALSTIFQNLSTLVVVGYGGRERSVMELLTDASARFPDKRLLWIAHQSNPNSLTEFVKIFLATSRNSSAILGQDADDFFLQLMQLLGVGMPEAIREPLALAERYANTLAAGGSLTRPSVRIIAQETLRCSDEMKVAARALKDHRAARGKTDNLVMEARMLRLAGETKKAYEILLNASKETDDSELSRDLAVTAVRYGLTVQDSSALRTAVKVFQNVTKKIDIQNDPATWAECYYNLAFALRNLADRDPDISLLNDAKSAIDEALRLWADDKGKLRGMALNELGNILARIAERSGDPEKYDEAIAAFEEALKVRNSDEFPLDWATTQISLAATFGTRAKLRGEENETTDLEKSVAALRSALSQITLERMPREWALAQNNLGGSLIELGEREKDFGKIEAGATAILNSLRVYTFESTPLEWARSQVNLGGALLYLGEQVRDAKRIRAGMDCFRSAMTVYTREASLVSWAICKLNFGAALTTLGAIAKDKKCIFDGIDEIKASAEVFQSGGMRTHLEMANKNIAEAEKEITDLDAKSR